MGKEVKLHPALKILRLLQLNLALRFLAAQTKVEPKGYSVLLPARTKGQFFKRHKCFPDIKF